MTGRDLLLSVDLSGSMEEQDFQLNGEWVDRLTALKSVATDFIERRVGDRVGLILFGREAYLQAPLTFDRATVSTLLDESVDRARGQGDGDRRLDRPRDPHARGRRRRARPARAAALDRRREHGRRRRAAQGRRARRAAQDGHLHDRHRRRFADRALAVRLARDQSVGRSRRGDVDRDRRDDGRPILPRARHDGVRRDLQRSWTSSSPPSPTSAASGRSPSCSTGRSERPSCSRWARRCSGFAAARWQWSRATLGCEQRGLEHG